MTRTLYLLIAVVLLGGGTWWIVTSGQTPEKVGDRAVERQFGYADVDDLSRIFVADRSGHSITLTRGGITGWLADGKPANENVLKNLLQAVKTIEVQSLPTQKAIPNMIQSLATSGILVQLYDRDDRKVRGYYIGGSTSDERGTFGIVEGSENPYIVHLAGWTGNLRHRFNLWDDEWRDRVYFRADPDQVELLSIDYPKQRNKSFRLERTGNNFRISPLYETGQPAREIPRGVAEGILVRYESFYVNRYENQDQESITQARELLPFAVITLKEKDKDAQEMRIYPRFTGLTLGQDPKTGAMSQSNTLEAYTAFINGGQDWVLLNVETTQPLLVAYDSF